MTTALLIALIVLALSIGFHPRWGRIINRSRWPWWRLIYLAMLLGVAVAGAALKLMGWWR